MNRLRVVVVDDQEDAARLVAQVLELSLGCEVHVRLDGAEAVDAVSELRPDAVLMDVQMPGIDGLQAAAVLARLFPAGRRPRLVAVTGLDLARWRDALRAAGFDAVVPKPAPVAALVAALAGAAAPQIDG